MNTFKTQQEAERRAVSDFRCGFMSDNKKTIYRNGCGEFVLVGDPAFAHGPIVSMVIKGKVYPS